MSLRIPFSTYDFFAYLSCGFFLLVAANHAFNLGFPLGDGVSLPEGSFLVLVAYIVGQITAEPSAWLLERRFAIGWIGSPNASLFQEVRGWRRLLFPRYTIPLPEETRRRVLDKAKREGFTGSGEALFLHALAKVKKDETILERLNIFLSLYGFCRNMAFALLVSALLLAVGVIIDPRSSRWLWVAFSIGAATGMLYRYLKFFRQYSFEVFITYAEM